MDLYVGQNLQPMKNHVQIQARRIEKPENGWKRTLCRYSVSAWCIKCVIIFFVANRQMSYVYLKLILRFLCNSGVVNQYQIYIMPY